MSWSPVRGFQGILPLKLCKNEVLGHGQVSVLYSYMPLFFYIYLGVQPKTFKSSLIPPRNVSKNFLLDKCCFVTELVTWFHSLTGVKMGTSKFDEDYYDKGSRVKFQSLVFFKIPKPVFLHEARTMPN